jgi:hypothetical protein
VAVQDRWEARVFSYAGREDRVKQVKLAVRDLARREQRGDPLSLDANAP